jgi:peroxiredoxin
MQRSISNLKNSLAALLLLVFGMSVCVFNAQAADTKEKGKTEDAADEKKADEKSDEEDFTVPDGDTSDLLKFVRKMQSWQPKVEMPKMPKDRNDKEEVKKFQEAFLKYRAEMMAKRGDIVKAREAGLTALEKILEKKDLGDKDRVAALKAKLAGLNELGSSLGDGKARAKFEKLVEQLLTDKDSGLAKQAKTEFLAIRISRLLNENSKESPQELTKEILANIDADDKFNGAAVMQANNAARYMQMRGEYQLTRDLYNGALKALESDGAKKLPADQLSNMIKSTKKSLELVNLIGTKAELKGKLVTGEDFDVSSYKGKVVLIDFWATWCGPCIGELPNVVENYKKYHDKGLEIVGISIDKEEDKLKNFIKEKELPWVQIFSDDENARGWEDPRIAQYHVSGIPATFLLDREGNIVHLNVRGKRLGKVLEEMLGN